jgi:hypothetical protein
MSAQLRANPQITTSDAFVSFAVDEAIDSVNDPNIAMDAL